MDSDLTEIGVKTNRKSINFHQRKCKGTKYKIER